MADNIEKLIFKDNYISKAEKSRVSFWLSNLKDDEKLNLVSLIGCIKKDDSGLYLIGGSLEGVKYGSIDFMLFDSEVNSFVGNYFSIQNLKELNDNFLRYSIFRFGKDFSKKESIENNRYNYENSALIELTPKKGSKINLYIPIIFSPKINANQCYSDYKAFENEITRKITSHPLLAFFKSRK